MAQLIHDMIVAFAPRHGCHPRFLKQIRVYRTTLQARCLAGPSAFEREGDVLAEARAIVVAEGFRIAKALQDRI